MIIYLGVCDIALNIWKFRHLKIIAVVILKWAASWQNQQNDCAPSEDSDQPGHLLSLIRVRPVWSESSLIAEWIAKDQSFLHADSEDSDQTGWMPRLIRLGGYPGWSESSLGAHAILLVLSWGDTDLNNAILTYTCSIVSETWGQNGKQCRLWSVWSWSTLCRPACL